MSRLRSRHRPVLLLALLAGCRPAPVALENPADYLVAGVEPRAEADAVTEGFRRAGYLVDTRVEGITYVALGAHRNADGASAVRVITKLGIMLGADVPDRAFPTRERVTLLDFGRDLDFDGDSLSEVAIRVVDPMLLGSCVAIVRIDAEGGAQEIAISTLAYGSRACVEEVADVAGDARPEALVPLRLVELATGDVAPTVYVPFEGNRGVWSELDPATAQGFHEREDAVRVERIAYARASHEPATVGRLAIERAMLAAMLGKDAAAQHAVLDASVAGVTLDVATRGAVLRAHSAIEGGLVPVAQRSTPANAEPPQGESSSSSGSSDSRASTGASPREP